MPGVFRHSVDKLLPIVEQALTYGIPAMAIFPLALAAVFAWIAYQRRDSITALLGR